MQNVRDRQAKQLDAYILRINGVVGAMDVLGHQEFNSVSSLSNINKFQIYYFLSVRKSWKEKVPWLSTGCDLTHTKRKGTNNASGQTVFFFWHVHALLG